MSDTKDLVDVDDGRRFYSYDYKWGRDANHIKLVLTTWRVARETPKGLWLEPYTGQEGDPGRNFIGQLLPMDDMIWINPKTKRAKAYPTKEEAMHSFLRRKRGWLKRLQHCVRMAEAMIELGESDDPTDDEAMLDPNWSPPRYSLWDDY